MTDQSHDAGRGMAPAGDGERCLVRTQTEDARTGPPLA